MVIELKKIILFLNFTFYRASEDDSDELSDRDVNKLLIVTQTTSSRAPKHEGYDRTGDWTTRVKITQELEQAINDGLYYYEEDLWTVQDFVSYLKFYCFLYFFYCFLFILFSLRKPININPLTIDFSKIYNSWNV